jgi:hypothetical protein
MRVITNAVHWARPRVGIADKCPNVKLLEELNSSGAQFDKAEVVACSLGCQHAADHA